MDPIFDEMKKVPVCSSLSEAVSYVCGDGVVIDRLLNNLDKFLFEPERSSLLHGDLWSGNFMSDESGLPVLIDPAVYIGCNEADIAMTELFGGFDRRLF